MQITNGREQMDMVLNSMACLSNYEHTESEAEVEAIANYLETFQDWSNIVSEIGIGERVKVALSMNEDIKELERMGFLVFGRLHDQKYRASKTNIITFSVAVLNILRKDNASIWSNEDGSIKGTLAAVPTWIKGFTV